jgi:hypothetical protein
VIYKIKRKQLRDLKKVFKDHLLDHIGRMEKEKVPHNAPELIFIHKNNSDKDEYILFHQTKLSDFITQA